VQNGLPAYLIEDEGEIEPKWFKQKVKLGITAGASTPEILVQGVLARLSSYGKLSVREMEGRQETIRFSLPKSKYL
jgi:4-hydroxy-3-methylbut-2-enyl diphosphate reductase